MTKYEFRGQTAGTGIIYRVTGTVERDRLGRVVKLIFRLGDGTTSISDPRQARKQYAAFNVSHEGRIGPSPFECVLDRLYSLMR